MDMKVFNGRYSTRKERNQPILPTSESFTGEIQKIPAKERKSRPSFRCYLYKSVRTENWKQMNYK